MKARGNLGTSDIGARGKRRGFCPGAAAHHRSRTRSVGSNFVTFFIFFVEIVQSFNLFPRDWTRFIVALPGSVLPH